ncbi:phage portal protein [Oceanidesulfovibrio marinus]|uniref:Phage portal protein n=1 Tax=Oceanidesulfovibrio marinus TaxID=370038 RepID=A0ABX6NJ55_9BACT|nr:phage portal protein [Oceanidesulfovibrio marinus]QJT10241.1 phage portal protein [Oceanidesulfovibrio marinus]
MRKQLVTRRASRAKHARRHSASLQGALSNWTNSIVSRREAERQIERSAERALDLYHNDAMAHGVLESLVVESVGIGLTPQPAPRADWLDLTAEWEAEFQTATARCWEEWGLDCRHWCDATRRLNIYGLQALAYFQWKLLGVGVFQVIAKPRPGAPFSTCLLPIDPFRLVTPSDLAESDIYDGVQIDADGEPEKVWIRKPGALSMRPPSSDCASYDVFDQKTGLPRFLLVCDVRNVAEYRQDSLLGPMIGEIRHSNDLAEAAVVGAMVRNLFTLFINDFGQGAVDRNTPWHQRVMELEKGTVLFGSGKEKPTFFQPDAAPSRYSEMFGAIIDRLGMSTGRGAENVLRKFQASYSASKASMEKADQFNEFEHRVLNDQFNQPVWSWILYEAALRNRVPLKPQEYLRNLYAYSCCEHLAQPMRQIDREKGAKASVLELGSHTTSYREIYGRMGRNWRSGLRQVAQEKAFIKELEAEFDVDMSSYTIPDAVWKTDEASEETNESE